MLIPTKKFLLAAFAVVCLLPSAKAGFFPGGGLRDHGHTAPGDGGVLANPRITGGDIALSTATVNYQLTVGTSTTGSSTSVAGGKSVDQTISVGAAQNVTFVESVDSRNEWNSSTYTAAASQNITFTASGHVRNGDTELTDGDQVVLTLRKNGSVTLASWSGTPENSGEEAFSLSTTTAITLGDTVVLISSVTHGSNVYYVTDDSTMTITGDGSAPVISVGGLTVNCPSIFNETVGLSGYLNSLGAANFNGVVTVGGMDIVETNVVAVSTIVFLPVNSSLYPLSLTKVKDRLDEFNGSTFTATYTGWYEIGSGGFAVAGSTTSAIKSFLIETIGFSTLGVFDGGVLYDLTGRFTDKEPYFTVLPLKSSELVYLTAGQHFYLNVSNFIAGGSDQIRVILDFYVKRIR